MNLERALTGLALVYTRPQPTPATKFAQELEYGLVGIEGRRWIAGGALRDGDNWSVIGSDVDLWVTHIEPAKRALESLRWVPIAVMEYHGHICIKFVKHLRYWNLARLDLLEGTTPEETILGFDYTVNAIAYDLRTRMLVMHPQHRDHLERRVLVPIGNGRGIPNGRQEAMIRKGFRLPRKGERSE